MICILTFLIISGVIFGETQANCNTDLTNDNRCDAYNKNYACWDTIFDIICYNFDSSVDNYCCGYFDELLDSDCLSITVKETKGTRRCGKDDDLVGVIDGYIKRICLLSD